MEVLKLETWEQLFDPEVVNLDKVQEYLDFIVEARDRYDPDRYSEWHHVIPKCIDPDKKFRDQGVQINGRDHLLAHMKLVECFNGSIKCTLSYALVWMRSQVSSRGEGITPEEWEEVRRLRAESCSKESLPDEILQRRSDSLKGNQNKRGWKAPQSTLDKQSRAMKERRKSMTFNVICKTCGEKFVAPTPHNKYCNRCREVLQ